ncbi:MAG: DNA-directed RNA polymerase subunit L [Candidatus Bathyarchaeota archaeon]|nr:DNA-directed RNA polymerase subunit L [Candidatus Bathyarchaeota archaeon]MDH5787645.1 DNA-directed RNA polymerase subunit L [Candidatus Bathyarchaeota archaeon]
MKIRVLKRSSDELKIEIEGTGHTLCNLVQKKLLEDENVDLAGYNIPHPLASTSIIYVRTKGDVKPEVSLQGAVKKARKMNKEFGKEFQKTLKKI